MEESKTAAIEQEAAMKYKKLQGEYSGLVQKMVDIEEEKKEYA